ncbi:MAG: hypothetical protein M1435_04150 [Actinobacteria bacterium]|jgi:hypothetical protein|nr:hypothetical protein [Actinomycetota bacterium]
MERLPAHEGYITKLTQAEDRGVRPDPPRPNQPENPNLGAALLLALVYGPLRSTTGFVRAVFRALVDHALRSFELPSAFSKDLDLEQLG